ncbi:MAG: PAS domain-containing protein [Alphaproteobacteria bacterium]|nr:PAS domain-containing protein [Alphaproteobacteria bacterium]
MPPLDAQLARQVLEAAPTVMYVYDVQREQSVFQNRRFGELLGYPPSGDPAHRSDWAAHIHEDDARDFPAHRERLKAIKPGETLLWEYRMRDASGDWRWFLSRDSLLSSDGRGAPQLIVGCAFEITEQKLAEQHKELLADEMRHRARNLVSLVQAIGRMSRPKDQPDVNKHLDIFMGRLLTILNTGGIVLSSTARTAELGAVIEATLKPFASADVTSRISAEGPPVMLGEHTAGGLALAFHELATNAIKYGALSVETGSIAVRWTLEGKRFIMEWKESGGPPVAPPQQEGFGGMVIRQSIARERGARIAIDYLPDGLRCRFEYEVP